MKVYVIGFAYTSIPCLKKICRFLMNVNREKLISADDQRRLGIVAEMAEMTECIFSCRKCPSLFYNTHKNVIKTPILPLPPLTMTTPTLISQYPGVLWLIFSLPRIVAPAFLVYVFISSSLGFLVGWESLGSSRWKVAVASALTSPAAFFCSITWRRLKVASRARTLGATSPPVIAGRLPGSLDIVWVGAKSRFTAYPGEETLATVTSRT